MYPYFEDYWPWYVTAWGLYALGGSLLAWALFWDRAKRGGKVRHRCPKCWYDMQGVVELDPWPDDTCCPECGRSIKIRRDLTRTRRPWRSLILLAILLLLAHTCRRYPLTKNHTWIAIIPSTVLILLPPIDVESFRDFNFTYSGNRPMNRFWREIHRRFRNEELWFWQEDLLQFRVHVKLKWNTNYGMSESERTLASRLHLERMKTPERYLPLDEFIIHFTKTTGIDVTIAMASIEEVDDTTILPWHPNSEVSFDSLLDEIMGSQLPITSLDRSFVDWAIHDDHLVIMPRDEIETCTRTKMFDVSELLDGYPDDMDHLIHLIQSFINPRHWLVYGGEIGHIGLVGDHLIVRTTVRHLFQIELLLSLLLDQRKWLYENNEIERLRESSCLDARVTRRRDIGDLVQLGYSIEEVMDLVMMCTDPEHWKELGGEIGHIMPFQDSLIIQTTLAHHDRLDRVFDLLRGKIDSIPFRMISETTNSDSKSEQLLFRLYPIGDIATNEESVIQLVSVIQSAITLGDWYAHHGDSAWMQVYNRVAFVGQTEIGHESLVNLLAGLRSKLDQGFTHEQLFARLDTEFRKYGDFPALIDQFLNSEDPPKD